MRAIAPDPSNCHERQRLNLLGCTRLLDTEASEGFDRITRLAVRLFNTPIALVTLVDERRQWFKSRYGFDVEETSRESSFCAHAIQRGEVMVVEDAMLDKRFARNPLVQGPPNIRFYAGAPLMLESGHALGSLCVIDTVPRTFTAEQCERLADMAALVMAQIDLHQRAGRINEVTRLPNRAQMIDDLEQLCADFAGESRALMLVDIMAYQQLQAAVRAVGIAPLEATLREIAAKLQQILGMGVALYHVSETRFSFLLPDTLTAKHDHFAARVLSHLREPFTSGGLSVELEVEAGLVSFPLETASAGDVLRKATSAMHESASKGSSYLWYGSRFDAADRRAFALLRDISPGLARGEFRLVFQPKLNLHSGQYSGVEALARWKHPRYGDVSPAEFIPLVESTMLIHEFTQWALHTALAQLAAWRGQDVELTMAVNVSSHNLDHPSFVRVVREACALHGVRPSRLHVECTENAIMTSTITQASLEALRDMGVQISLDDFGMGYSNLSCLSALPVELLKLDQSLIKPIATDARALKLAQSLIDLGHSLGYRMLAEGVETREVFDLIVAARCDAVQGYFLAKPLEAAELLAFLATPPPARTAKTA